jgi:hypothetical protein
MTPTVIAWRGPSVFDGTPIQVVLTGLRGGSLNEKTGRMVQAYILPADNHPVIAQRTGEDRAVCGDCPGRRTREGWCYVTPFPLLGIARSIIEGNVPVQAVEAERLVEGKSVRLGAYGDPAAVPLAFWRQLLRRAKAWTGYTHAWQTCDVRFQDLLMASVEDHRGATEALARGWRYFRVQAPGDLKLPSEVVCPNVTHEVQCHSCRLCAGLKVQAKNVVIPVHGFAAASFKQPRLF